MLQSRLHQLDLHSEVVTNRFDRETRDGVATFQRRRGWTADGVVDERTWLKIVSLTTEPTTEALHNVYTPGQPLLQRGDTGMWVRQVQARLKQVRWYDARVTGRYTRRDRRGRGGLPGQAPDPGDRRRSTGAPSRGSRR